MASNFVEAVKGLPGLRAYWRLNEESGTEAKDSSAQGNHGGTYAAGQDAESPVNGEFLLKPAGATFIGGDATSTGVVYVSNSNRSGAEAPFSGLGEPYAYGAYATLPEESPLEASKRALWAPTNQFGIGMFLELRKEPNITADLLSAGQEHAATVGWTLQVNSAEHAEAFQEAGGLTRQLLIYTFWHVAGTATSTLEKSLLTGVSLSKYAWENLIEGKSILKGFNLPNGEWSNEKNGENGDAVITTIKKVETEPGISKDGELVLNLNAIATGESTITAMGVSNTFTKRQLAFNRRYFLMVVYAGTLPGAQRMTFYLDGSEVATVTQPPLTGNITIGGVTPPTALQYPESDVGFPSRLLCLNAGGRLAAYSDSFPGRAGEVFLTTIAPSAAKVKELWEKANEATPVLTKPAAQSTEKGKAAALVLAGENIISYEVSGLPEGLTLTGPEITGTVTAAKGLYTVKVKGKNTLGEAAPEVSFNWTVEPVKELLLGSQTAHLPQRNTAVGKARACSFVAKASGFLPSVEVHAKRSVAGAEMQVGIWANASGKPGVLLVESAVTLVLGEGVATWTTCSFPTRLTVTSGVTYWIGVVALVQELIVTNTETVAGFVSETPVSVTKASQITKWKSVVSPAGGIFDIAGLGPLESPPTLRALIEPSAATGATVASANTGLLVASQKGGNA